MDIPRLPYITNIFGDKIADLSNEPDDDGLERGAWWRRAQGRVRQDGWREREVLKAIQAYPQISDRELGWAAESAYDIIESLGRERKSALKYEDAASIAELDAQIDKLKWQAHRLEAWRMRRLQHRAIYGTDRLIRRKYGDPGIPAADILAARQGNPKAQLRVHEWLTGVVRHAALNGLNVRSRKPEMLSMTVADVYADLVEGKAGSREACAQKAGVARGTYVQFRAAVFDPVADGMTLYMQRAALLSRHIKTRRSRHQAPYRLPRAANADNPVSAIGFRATSIGSERDPNDEKLPMPRSGMVNLDRLRTNMGGRGWGEVPDEDDDVM